MIEYEPPKKKNLLELNVGKSTVKKVIKFFKDKKKKELEFDSNQCDYCTWRSQPYSCPVVRKGEVCPKFTTEPCPKCDRNPCIC